MVEIPDGILAQELMFCTSWASMYGFSTFEGFVVLTLARSQVSVLEVG